VYEGQLSKTPLTFQDLRVIKETFLNILVGIYHSRVEYPDKDKEESGKAKKSSEQASSDKFEVKKDDYSDESPPTVDEYQNT
ncbi:MAG: hypothetical protein ACNS64_10755, partial [Candidatus Halalkalibacterium sp. M3_1C_030]